MSPDVIPQPSRTSIARTTEVDIQRAMSRIGEYVRDFRTDGRGWTQQELADKAGVDRNTIVRIESGQLGSMEVVLKVFHALGTLDALLKLVADEEILAIANARLISSRQRERSSKRDLEAQDAAPDLQEPPK